MITDTKKKLERTVGTQFPDLSPSKKPYESPELREWGSILELTSGDFADVTDAEGGGSQPV